MERSRDRKPRFRVFLIFAICVMTAACGRAYSFKLEHTEPRIESLIRIASYEYTFKEILYFGEQKSILGFKTVDKGFLASIDITLTAGYDLTEGFDMKADSFGTVTVSLPKPKILSIDADETSIREYYSYQRGEALTHMDLYGQINAVKPELIREAAAQGLFARAEENAQMLIGELLLSMGFKEVRFSPQAELKAGSE